VGEKVKPRQMFEVQQKVRQKMFVRAKVKPRQMFEVQQNREFSRQIVENFRLFHNFSIKTLKTLAQIKKNVYLCTFLLRRYINYMKTHRKNTLHTCAKLPGNQRFLKQINLKI
jgi:saccharopine dehydrogenase-like NADP-dependent oxidoreductase